MPVENPLIVICLWLCFDLFVNTAWLMWKHYNLRANQELVIVQFTRNGKEPQWSCLMQCTEVWNMHVKCNSANNRRELLILEKVCIMFKWIIAIWLMVLCRNAFLSQSQSNKSITLEIPSIWWLSFQYWHDAVAFWELRHSAVIWIELTQECLIHQLSKSKPYWQLALN